MESRWEDIDTRVETPPLLPAHRRRGRIGPVGAGPGLPAEPGDVAAAGDGADVTAPPGRLTRQDGCAGPRHDLLQCGDMLVERGPSDAGEPGRGAWALADEALANLDVAGVVERGQLLR